jgi:hypothetical protein
MFCNAEIVNAITTHCTGKYKVLQGNPCNENRFFPVRLDLQGVPCKPYRVWVCSATKEKID